MGKRLNFALQKIKCRLLPKAQVKAAEEMIAAFDPLNAPALGRNAGGKRGKRVGQAVQWQTKVTLDGDMRREAFASERDRQAGDFFYQRPFLSGGGKQPDGVFAFWHDYFPTLASTSALRKRSTNCMNNTDGTSSSRAVIEAIW